MATLSANRPSELRKSKPRKRRPANYAFLTPRLRAVAIDLFLCTSSSDGMQKFKSEAVQVFAILRI